MQAILPLNFAHVLCLLASCTLHACLLASCTLHACLLASTHTLSVLTPTRICLHAALAYSIIMMQLTSYNLQMTSYFEPSEIKGFKPTAVLAGTKRQLCCQGVRVVHHSMIVRLGASELLTLLCK